VLHACVCVGERVFMCVCACVHACVCACKQEFRMVNIPSKRQTELFVEHHPLAHRILSLSGTMFLVQLVHSVDGKVGAQVMPLQLGYLSASKGFYTLERRICAPMTAPIQVPSSLQWFYLVEADVLFDRCEKIPQDSFELSMPA